MTKLHNSCRICESKSSASVGRYSCCQDISRAYHTELLGLSMRLIGFDEPIRFSYFRRPIINELRISCRVLKVHNQSSRSQNDTCMSVLFSLRLGYVHMRMVATSITGIRKTTVTVYVKRNAKVGACVCVNVWICVHVRLCLVVRTKF